MVNNSVKLIGRLTKDPAMASTPGGTTVASFTLAVKDRAKRGEEDRTYFHFCKAFGRTAEVILDYVRKGEQIAVEGKLVTSDYTNKEGHRTISTTVFVNEIYFLEKKRTAEDENFSEAELEALDNGGFEVQYDEDGVEF